MKFAELMSKVGASYDIVGDHEQYKGLEVDGIVYDSRKVKPGDIFVAISGMKEDGHKYVPAALANGAAALVVEHAQEDVPPAVPQIVVEDSRAFLGFLASAFYAEPDKELYLIGITGTNGKTTTTYLIKWLFECARRKTGLIGTIQNYIGEQRLPAHQTTPESVEIFSMLRAMRDANCDSAVMEVSSHSLKQGRVALCDFDVAVFTNLTQDHLDYHHTFADYRDSKAILFRMLRKAGARRPRFAVINRDDPAAAAMAANCLVPIYYYGIDQDADLRVRQYSSSPQGSSFILEYRGQSYVVKIPLIGKFNIYNVLAALAVACGSGLHMEDCLHWLGKAPQVPGRFELVDEGQDFTVVVDYAHTPDGLLNVLNTARALSPRRLISVFGCGGDRDRTKRPIMAKIGGEHSDYVVLTSDNPRSEDPYVILDEVEAGIKDLGKPYVKIENRREAIRAAIREAKSGDMIVIAGKGHEDYQLVKDQVLHFDDRETVRKILREESR